MRCPLTARAATSSARLAALVVGVAIALAVGAGTASAAGGNYTFEGGTPDEQATVRAALNASSFPWDVVPVKVRIVIAAGIDTQSGPGVVQLDSRILDSGRFAWGIVQHEYAHQVDFLLFDEPLRKALLPLLGGKAWCWTNVPGRTLDHSDYACERFASTLAWAYWPSEANSLKPDSADSESAAVPPLLFRRLMRLFLRQHDSLAPGALDELIVGLVPPHAAAALPGSRGHRASLTP